MANQMDARAAFSAYSTAIPRVQEEIVKQIQEGNVRLVYAAKPEDIKGKSFRDFLVKFNLITTDEAMKKAPRAGVGGGKSYTQPVDALTGGAASAIKQMVKDLNAALKETPYVVHFYIKSKEAVGSHAKAAETPIAQ